MKNSLIQWTDHTFNPVRGCTKVSPGCQNCYAARESVRFPNIRGIWGNAGTRIVAVPDAWKEPLRWNRQAVRMGVRQRVFCASLADVFEDWKGDLRFPADIAPEGWLTARWDGFQLVREFEASAEAQGLPKATMDNLRTELFRLIEDTPWLDWQLLTKRPENVMRMVPDHWRARFPENVWMGTTTENQAMADKRTPELLEIPAKVRFLSCEPLLGPVKIDHIRAGDNQWFPLQHIHWVICGGESGPGARPMHPDWARSIRDQCAAAAVPFFFKQWGEWLPSGMVPDKAESPRWTGEDGEFADCGGMIKVGKKEAGRQLDLIEHNNFPAPMRS